MKYPAPLIALVAATPAFAHHEAELAAASPLGLIAGVALLTLAGFVALGLRRRS